MSAWNGHPPPPPPAKSVMESASTRTFQCSGYCRRHSKDVPTSAYPRRDALRFHWIIREYPKKVRTLRFTRPLFGLSPSSFLLGGVIQHHLNKDLITLMLYQRSSGLCNTTFTEISEKASFKLYKWKSNVRELEASDALDKAGVVTYAKE